MNIITFNTLQFRVLTLLFVIFTSAVMGYRYFVELPKLEKSIALLANKVLSSLKFSIESMLNVTSNTTYDYAVWTSTYEFMLDVNEDYIAENFVDDTFTSLEFDGIFYVDHAFKLIKGKGYNHVSGEPLAFNFFDFERFPHYLAILPQPTIEKGTPETFGFMKTQYGPAVYCVNQVRTSNLDGENRGYLIVVKLVNKAFVEALSRFTLTNITLNTLNKSKDYKALPSWDETIILNNVHAYTEVLIKDMNKEPVFTLTIQHSKGKSPKLINQQTLMFISLLSVLVYLMYRLISKNMIDPVKRLACDIEAIGNEESDVYIKENHTIKELNTVANNINTLITMVKEQNDLLAIQATTDQLTQVLNRHGLDKALEDYKEQCVRHHVSFCVVMCDVDFFKPYNDALGHIEGDATLYRVAQNLNEQCKRKQDLCARYGGEEFTLLFSEMTETDLTKKIEDILNSFKSLNIPHPNSSVADYITVSMGAIVVKHEDVTAFDLPINDIVKHADNALYEAKSAGRNTFIVKSYSTFVNTCTNIDKC